MTARKAKSSKMTSTNLDKMSLRELQELREEIDIAIAEARERDRAEILSKMQELANEAGFSMNELVGQKSARGRQKPVSVARFANPDNRSETWTGRGRKPNWLVERLSKGANLEDFAI